jgi:hypothetical protein
MMTSGSFGDAESKETEAVLQRFNEVFLTHNPEALRELVAEDCIIENTQPAPDGSRHEGKHACIALWTVAKSGGGWSGTGTFRVSARRQCDARSKRAHEGRVNQRLGDINWGGITAFFLGLIAGWSMEDRLVAALQEPISGFLGGMLSWLFGIVVAGASYLVLSRRGVVAPSRRHDRPRHAEI